MVNSSLLNQVQRLDDAEKLEFIHALWDSIDHGARDVSEETHRLVREWAAAADAHPEDEISSDEFWDGIRQRYA